jgi:hypothetical protein
MLLRGTIQNGSVILDSVGSLPNGTRVEVTPAGRAAPKPRKRTRPLLSDLAVRTGIRDLAAEHDHYASGAPKRSKKAKAIRRNVKASPRRKSGWPR